MRQAVGDGIFFAHLDRQHLALSHRVDVVTKALEGRAGVEDIDVTLVTKPLGLEHSPRRLRGDVNFADHRARLGWQQCGIYRQSRHQLRDERLLPDASQIVGARILHGEEVSPETFPERALAFRIELAANFCNHFGSKALREFGNE